MRYSLDLFSIVWISFGNITLLKVYYDERLVAVDVCSFRLYDVAVHVNVSRYLVMLFSFFPISVKYLLCQNSSLFSIFRGSRDE